MPVMRPVLGMIGGAGALGTGLARRWVRAGYAVIIGSRDSGRAKDAAAALAVPEGGAAPQGASYAETAAAADIVIMTIPFVHQAAVMDEIKPGMRGKIILDTTVPLIHPDAARVQLPEAGSAAVAAQQRLGDIARVVSAFHNVPARRLQQDLMIDCDVLVFGDQSADRQMAISLVEAAGMRGIHGGPLINSVAAEALTSVLIGINRNYKVGNAGLLITGLD
jgi:8-hydroxy-5-deazaflavin:NADPH oxidoreductase